MTLRNQGAQNLSMAELYEGSAKAGVRFSQPREVVSRKPSLQTFITYMFQLKYSDN